MSSGRNWHWGTGALLCLALLAVNIASVSSQLGFIHKPGQVKERDHLRYLEMAKGPFGKPSLANESTYCWRVLVPALARTLANATNGNLNHAFYAITNVSLFGFLLAFWAYLGVLGFSLPFRVAGLSILGLTQGAVRWYEYQYWMTDPLCFFFLVLALLWIRMGRIAPLYPISVAAAFVREAYVIVYAHYLLRQWKQGAPLRKAALRTAALAAVPFGVLVALRILIVPNHPDDFLADIYDTMGFRLRRLTDNQPYMLTVGSFGVVFPLVLLFPARLWAMARTHYDHLVIVVFFYGLLLVANNTERELAYALPVLVPAALKTLADFLAETRLPAVPFLAAAVGLQVLFFSQQRFAEAGMSMYQPTNLLVAASMGLFWVALQVTLHLRRKTLSEYSQLR
jgi:hypothetical protein